MEMNGSITDLETLKNSPSRQILISVIFGIIVLTGIVGNVLVITLVSLVRQMRTAVNLCLLSLAFADLTFLVFLPILPILYLYHLDQSFMGTPFCIFNRSIDRGIQVCSVLTFLLIGVERYTVLCYPLKSLGMWTNRRVCLLLVLIWAISVGVCIPYTYVAKLAPCNIGNGTEMCCIIDDPPWFTRYQTALTSLSFLLPIPLLAFLYGKMIITLKTQVPQNDTQSQGTEVARKGRLRVIVMLAIIVILFIVCLLPFHALYVWFINDIASFMVLGYHVMTGIDWGCRILSYINNIVNPIVYFLMSDNFRQAFRDVFCR